MGIVENAKDVVKLVQQLDNIDLTEKILGLQADVLGLIEEKHTLQAKVRKLEEQLESMQQEFATDADLSLKNDCYWRTTDEAPGPYCTRCWNVDSVLVQMHRGAGGWAICPHCDTRARAWPEEPQPAPKGIKFRR